MSQANLKYTRWWPACQNSDLVANSGVCVLLGEPFSARKSIALFFIPGAQPEVYAIDNWDPIAKCGVIARGLLAEVDGRTTVASPLYKHHFRLEDGVCVEDESIRLATYSVAFDGDTVMIALEPEKP